MGRHGRKKPRPSAAALARAPAAAARAPPNPRQARDLADLHEIFPCHLLSQIESVYNSFPPNSLADISICLANLAPAVTLAAPVLEFLHEVFPGEPMPRLASVLAECGADAARASEVVRRDLTQSGLLPDGAAADRVSYRAFLEVDMHGCGYSWDEWITVVRVAIDFITGQGIHSAANPMLHPLTVATLFWLEYDAAVDPTNPGIVRASKKAVGPEVRAFVARHQGVPTAPAQALLAFADHDEETAARLAETIRAALERSDADVASQEERSRIRAQNEVVFHLEEESGGLPVSVVKKLAFESGYDAKRAGQAPGNRGQGRCR
jgi:hypothetical protein